MEFNAPVMELEPPGFNTPLVAERLNQLDGGDKAQLSGIDPKFVKMYVWLTSQNGPPTGPPDVNPFNGVIFNDSGVAKAVIRLLPLGVPHPVHRSNPGTAWKEFGLVPLVLSPVVTS